MPPGRIWGSGACLLAQGQMPPDWSGFACLIVLWEGRPTVNRMTDRCENIPFLQLSLQVGKMQVPLSNSCLDPQCAQCATNMSLRKRQSILFLSSQSAKSMHRNLTQCSLTVNECDWHILAGNDERINAHCLNRGQLCRIKNNPFLA